VNLRTAATAALGTVSDEIAFNTKQLLVDSSVIVCTGIGKSDDMARLAASLLQSVGRPAIPIHATNLLHGGLTVLRSSPRPAILALSHSGLTEEILTVLRTTRRYVLITGGAHNPMAPEVVVCRYVIPGEGGVHGTIPSASLHGQLAYVTAIACMIGDDLPVMDLAAGHPDGDLGARYRNMGSGREPSREPRARFDVV